MREKDKGSFFDDGDDPILAMSKVCRNKKGGNKSNRIIAFIPLTNSHQTGIGLFYYKLVEQHTSSSKSHDNFNQSECIILM